MDSLDDMCFFPLLRLRSGVKKKKMSVKFVDRVHLTTWMWSVGFVRGTWRWMSLKEAAGRNQGEGRREYLSGYRDDRENKRQVHLASCINNKWGNVNLIEVKRSGLFTVG